MISLSLKNPVKIVITAPEDVRPDYETIGKLLDNIIVLASEQKISLEKEDALYHCEFVVGKKNKFAADLKVAKTVYILVISYIKELTKYESTRLFAIPPKEKMKIKEAEALAKEQIKAQKKTTKKEEPKYDYSDLD